MATSPNYCLVFTQICMPMSEWAVVWQAFGIIITIIFGSVGLYKIYHELVRLKEQRDKDISDKSTAAKLKRTEFFLAQHRRIFDDKDLFEILCLIDADDPLLADKSLWDKKRKFIAFFEEIALLVKSEQINKDVAYYMFGYYSLCVRHGVNFCVGIDLSREYWALFYDFTDNASKYLDKNKDGPPKSVSL
jgi:hypothetical protein